MTEEEWATWRVGWKVTGYALPGARPCVDCPLGWAAEMKAQGRCNGTPGGVEEDEEEMDVTGGEPIVRMMPRSEPRTEVQVKAPCPTCGHREVCRIRTQIDGLDETEVTLPALDPAITVTLIATAKCAYWIQARDRVKQPVWSEEQRAKAAERVRLRNQQRRKGA